MEKRSHRRIRDLDVLTAFQGLVANEIGCARISMMAREQETLLQRAEYRRARPIISRSSHLACTARPVHTKYMVQGGSQSQVWKTFFRNHGLAIAAIDVRLGISKKTAANHVEHIYAKIGVSNRALASLFAVKHGLIGDDDTDSETRQR